MIAALVFVGVIFGMLVYAFIVNMPSKKKRSRSNPSVESWHRRVK